MATNSIDPAATGCLRLDRTGEVIGPATSASALADLRAAAAGRLHLGGDASLSLGDQVVHGATFRTTARFSGDRLAQVELCMVRSAAGEQWANWTHENEMHRKAAHERWAAEVFGRAMDLLPFPGPERIVPAEPGPEHPRGAAFPWGMVGSYYDAKGGCAWLVIRYGAAE